MPYRPPYAAGRRKSPFLREKKERISTLRSTEQRQTSWMDRPTPGKFLAQNLREVGELLSHIQQIQEEGSMAHAPNLFNNYLNRASKELVDLCKLITDRMKGAQDMEILEATASLISELALAETDDTRMEALAATMNEIQPTDIAIASALSSATSLSVTEDRSTLDWDSGKLVANADFDVAVAFDGQPPIEFTVRAKQPIDFDSITLKSDTSS